MRTMYSQARDAAGPGHRGAAVEDCPALALTDIGAALARRAVVVGCALFWGATLWLIL